MVTTARAACAAKPTWDCRGRARTASHAIRSVPTYAFDLCEHARKPVWHASSDATKTRSGHERSGLPSATHASEQHGSFAHGSAAYSTPTGSDASSSTEHRHAPRHERFKHGSWRNASWCSAEPWPWIPPIAHVARPSAAFAVVSTAQHATVRPASSPAVTASAAISDACVSAASSRPKQCFHAWYASAAVPDHGRHGSLYAWRGPWVSSHGPKPIPA